MTLQAGRDLVPIQRYQGNTFHTTRSYSLFSVYFHKVYELLPSVFQNQRTLPDVANLFLVPIPHDYVAIEVPASRGEPSVVAREAA